jgi:uncharacterized protein (TIGR03083 family)
MTKAKILSELRAARADWKALLIEVGEARMTEPGAAGTWSVKDVLAHLSGYARWFVNASEAHFRGENPPTDGTEGMDEETLNQHFYNQSKDKPLAEILAEWRRVSDRLVEVVERHEEAFLIEPQKFPGAPEPVLVWEILKGDNYGHAREHAQAVREWLAKTGE